MANGGARSAGDQGNSLLSARSNLYVGIYLAIIGLVAIVIFAAFAAENGVGVLAVSASIGLGALAFGLFLGFLFGIPRTSGTSPVPALPPTGSPAGGATAAGGDEVAVEPDHQVNTNLQDISDWLTKIIVGVSLVEFGNLTSRLGAFVTNVQGDFANVPGMDTFVLGIIVLYFMTGLLFGFLWTRLELQGLIGMSDRSLLGRLRARIVQENADAKLLDLVAAAADGQRAMPPAQTMSDAMRLASTDTRRLAFYRAREFRRNCVSSGNLANLNRVIPIFEGLIAADKAEFGGEGRYHRNYGQVAYAYKDRPEHSYKRAIDLLTTAIKLRDTVAKAEAQYYHVYEFNRAYSQIMLDADFSNNKKSDPALAALVIADLEVALRDPKLLDLVNSDQETNAWLDMNELKVENGKIVAK